MQQICVITGKLPMESGTSQNGNQWKRLTLLTETLEERPKLVAINFLGSMADVAARESVGNVVKISLSAESHEHEGRYYTELRGFQIRPAYNAPGSTSSSANNPTNNQSGSMGDPSSPGADFDPNDPNYQDLPY